MRQRSQFEYVRAVASVPTNGPSNITRRRLRTPWQGWTRCVAPTTAVNLYTHSWFFSCPMAISELSTFSISSVAKSLMLNLNSMTRPCCFDRARKLGVFFCEVVRSKDYTLLVVSNVDTSIDVIYSIIRRTVYKLQV